MKNLKYIIGTVLVIILMAVIYKVSTNLTVEKNSLMPEVEDDHDHDEERGEEIHLNRAQFENAALITGDFEEKNLNEVIHANGYTKIPPQNQADVAVFMSGIVTSIKVIEGQHVKKGQVLAIIESPEITKIQENYLVSKSNLAYLTLDYERQMKLSEDNINAKKTVEVTKSNRDSEQARFNSLTKQLELLGINGNEKTVSSISVLAPISGNITEIDIKIGTLVEMGKPLFAIIDNTEMHIDLLVYEKDLGLVEEGQNVRFNLTNQSNREIKGTIFNIGKSFENETKTVAVHAHIEETTENLIPGMYVNAIIDIGVHTVRALPESAVIKAEGRTFIFVQKPAHDHAEDEVEFVRIEVSTGPSQLGFIQVTPLQKIYKNEKIVIEGAFYLQSHLTKSEGGGGHSH